MLTAGASAAHSNLAFLGMWRYFLRGAVWSHDKAGPVQFVHNGEIQHMAQGAPVLGLK